MKRRERLSRGGYRKVGGIFLVLVAFSILGVVFGTRETYAVIGGDGSQPTGGGGGGNIGAALVHYKYVQSTGTAVVGTSTSPMGAKSETISNECRNVEGFWHIEWADLSSGKSGGSAAAARTLGEFKATNNSFASYLSDADGTAAKNKVNSDNYNSVVEPDKIVTPVNFKKIYDTIYDDANVNSALIPAGKSSPMPFGPESTQGVYDGGDTAIGLGQCWGSGSLSCYGYIDDYSGTYGSPKNEIFVDSTFSYFCGTTSGGGTDTYVAPKPTTSVKPAGTDYTGSGTSASPYVFNSAGDKTINFTFKVQRDDSVDASGSKFQYVGRAKKGGAPSSSDNDLSTTKSNQTLAKSGSTSFSATLTVTVAEDDSKQQICGKTWSYYNKWDGSSWSSPIAWSTKAGRTKKTCIWVQGPAHVPEESTTSTSESASTEVNPDGWSCISGSGGSTSDPCIVSSAGDYNFKSVHKIKRTDSNLPKKATLYWWAGSNTSTVPDAPSWTTKSNVQKSNSWTTVKTSDAFSHSVSSTVSSVCAATAVKGSNYKFVDGVLDTSATTAKADSAKTPSTKCFYIRSQTVQTMNFSGDVTFNKGTASGTAGNRTYTYDLGGLTESVSLTATHKLSGTVPSGKSVTPYCKISDWSDTAPGASDLANTTSDCAMANTFDGSNTSRQGTKTKSVTVSIGGAAKTVCSSFRFEKSITWTDGTISSTRPPVAANTSTAKACITLNNTPLTGSVSFSGLSKGALYTGTGTGGLSTAYLQKVNTFNFDSGPSTSNYSSIEAQLKYTQSTRTGHYLVKFNHYLKYTAKPDWLKPEDDDTKYNYPNGRYVIQQRVGGDGATWTKVGSWSNKRLETTTDSWVTVATETVDLELPTSGKYARVCQQIRYYSSADYTSEKTDGKIGDRKTLDDSTKTNATPACVIIRNPAWNNANGDTNTRTINVTGETPKWAGFTTESNIAGAVWSETKSKYVMRSISATARFKHMLTRTDSGFNEDNPGTVTDSDGSQNRTIASSPAVSDWSVTTGYKGIARVGTSGGHDVTPEGSGSGKTMYGATLSKPTWASGASATSTWKSTNYDAAAAAGGTTENGWTTMTLTYNTASGTAWRSIAAGDEKEFAQSIYNASKTWSLSYTDKFKVEAYCADVYTSESCTATAVDGGERHYVNTKRGGSSLTEDTSSNNTSSERKGTIRRDYNFAITSFLPNSGGDESLAAGESFTVDFTAAIKKDAGWNAYDTSSTGYGLSSALNRRYITGTGDDEKLVVITYVVKTRSAGSDTKDAYYTRLENAADGDLAGAGYNNNASDTTNNYCSFFSGKLGVYLDSCEMSDDSNRFSYDVTGVSGHNWVKAATGASDGYNGTLSQTKTVPNLTPGYKYCVALGASKKSSTSGNAVISGSFCTNVVKKPTVHVWGGSVSAKGAIKTTTTNVDPAGGSDKRPYASWTDLGIIAKGAVNKMASGRASADGTKVSAYGGVPCSTKYSPLTIANTGCTGNNPVGNSNVESQVNVYEKMKAKYVDITGAKYTTDVGHAADLAKGIAKSGAGVTGSIPAGGGAKVVYCSGDCVIKSDIRNDIDAAGNPRTFSNAGEIPQVVIIADGGIKINEAVTRVDAWLIANGTIDTCTYTDGSTEKSYTQGNAAVAHQLSANVCTNRLTINGPVVGGELNLTRTYGADNAASPSQVAEEGERSALSGTSLLFAGNEAEIGEPSTTYLKKMPARY